MFTILKIEHTDAGSIIKNFLMSKKFLPLFFYSPYTLNTWLMHEGKSLYIARLGGEEVLVLHKEKFNDIRFLFAVPSSLLLDEVTRYFEPRYIGFNELIDIPNEHAGAEDQELIIDIEQIADLDDKDIRYSYNKCLKRHPDLTVHRYNVAHLDAVNAFLENWSQARTEEQNKFAKVQNDKRFIDTYGEDESVLGIVVKDAEKVIAISFACPSLDGQVIGVINKCLRGYVQLGMFTFVERAKLMKSFGFTKGYLGSINNDFKKKFIPCGSVQKVYCKEVYRAPDFITKGLYILRLF